MGTDDPGTAGLAEEKAKISQACLRSFCFCPAPFALRMHLCFGLFVLIRIYRGKLGALPHSWRGRLSENFDLSAWKNGGDFLGTKAAVYRKIRLVCGDDLRLGILFGQDNDRGIAGIHRRILEH